MKNKINILKEQGIRITPQRVRIFELLAAEKRHLCVEELYEKIKESFPAVSLATVYSILELLKKKGIIREIRIKFDKSCYEARTDLHHHFSCRKCKKIFDIDLTPCPALQSKEINGHIIEELQGYFYGICRDCKEINSE
ncbi:MAG: Fur family transcriptional regulator [Candidatus Omnitrophota bacterium]